MSSSSASSASSTTARAHNISSGGAAAGQSHDRHSRPSVIVPTTAAPHQPESSAEFLTGELGGWEEVIEWMSDIRLGLKWKVFFFF